MVGKFIYTNHPATKVATNIVARYFPNKHKKNRRNISCGLHKKVSRDDWIRPPIGRSGDARSEANDIYLSPQPISTEYQPSRELSRPSMARCFVVGWARSSLLRPPHNKTYRRRKNTQASRTHPTHHKTQKKPQEHLLRSAQKS